MWSLRQAVQDFNEKPLHTLDEKKQLQMHRGKNQHEIKALKEELQRKENANAESLAFLVLRKSRMRITRLTRKVDQDRSPGQAIELITEAHAAGAGLLSACARMATACAPSSAVGRSSSMMAVVMIPY